MSVNLSEISGVLAINKPAGITSHTVVNKIRRLFGTRQVGHTGTLDPMATGVLPILIGRAVKASEYLVESGKAYRAVMRLGIESDTEDTTGNIIRECSDFPEPDEVVKIAESFCGEIEQIPPMYSALKVGGKKLVDIARQGGEVERQSRRVTIHSISCTYLSDSDYALDVSCSKGTYIRTLCADIGKKLGCGAAMADLSRTKSAGLTLEDAHTLEELESLSPEALAKCVLPLETMFSELEKVCLDGFFARLAKSGCEIYQKKIRTSFEVGTRVALYDKDGFFALGEVREYPDGIAIKAIKLFVI